MPVNHPTRRKILTKDVLATIPAMIDRGLKASKIAEELGCKITTLRVRCSQEKIRLHRPGSRSPRPDLLTIRMSMEALAQLQNRALLFGTTRANLAQEILETIVRDKLYDAVLDGNAGDRGVSTPPCHHKAKVLLPAKTNLFTDE